MILPFALWALEINSQIVVSTTFPSNQEINEEENLMGLIYSKSSPSLAVEVSGRVVEIIADVGDEVKAGTPILFDKLSEKKSCGFRAPTFSLNYKTSWTIDALIEKNYVYDSSVVPIKTKLYGFDHGQKNPYRISSSSLTKNNPNGKLFEFPLMIGKFFGKTMPMSGGFYLRSLPLRTSLTSIFRHPFLLKKRGRAV